jgi:hypothetical protein
MYTEQTASVLAHRTPQKLVFSQGYFNIPSPLRDQCQWVGVIDKKPYQLAVNQWTGSPYGFRQVEDQCASLREIDQAINPSWDDLKCGAPSYGFEHPGFWLKEDGGITCIDLDGALKADGSSLQPWAWAILNHFPGVWVERSQGGHGLHLFFLGHLPEPFGVQFVGKVKLSVGPIVYTPKIEVYSARKVITMTGDMATNLGTSADALIDGQEALEAFANRFMTEEARAWMKPPRKRSKTPLQGAVVDGLVAPMGGSTLEKLLNEETVGGGSTSEDDYRTVCLLLEVALAGRLKGDIAPEELEAVEETVFQTFMASERANREKVSQDQHRGVQYVRRTIKSALSNRTIKSALSKGF